MKERFEFAAVWLLLKLFGILPRGVARFLASSVVSILFASLAKLRKTAEFNLKLAFPDWTETQRRETLRNMGRYLAWEAVEFARFPRYKSGNIREVIEIEGEENFLSARNQGKGVLFLTGHIGAWELSSFAHALYGFPLHFMVRPIDNSFVDSLINGYRQLSGNKPIFKNESARSVLKILKDAGTVGILADQNTMPDEGVFVKFFGKLASTTSGVARLALHTGAAVVPGYAFWDAAAKKYKLRFEPPVELIRTGDDDRDIYENTQRFTTILENIIRRVPDQWVWVHARWKTRPTGEPSLYNFR